MPRKTNLENIGCIVLDGEACAIRRQTNGRLYVWSPTLGRLPYETDAGQEVLLEKGTFRGTGTSHGTADGPIPGAPDWIVNNTRPPKNPVPDQPPAPVPTDPAPVPEPTVPAPQSDPEPAEGTGDTDTTEGNDHDGNDKTERGWQPFIG